MIRMILVKFLWNQNRAYNNNNNKNNNNNNNNKDNNINNNNKRFSEFHLQTDSYDCSIR